jgi:hypothetical protein
MNSPLPGPWVDPELQDPEPWSSPEGIVKFFEFPTRIPQMSHRAFHLYWQKHHSPNVMNVTGFAQFMRKYNSGHRFAEAAFGLPAHYSQDAPYEGAAEVWINSWREVADWLGHPLYDALIRPDEPRFIAQTSDTIQFVTRKERVYESDPDMREDGKVKLYLLLRRRAELDRPEFHRMLSAHVRRALDLPACRADLRKFAVSHRLPDPCPIEGMPPCDVDAVCEFWVDDRAGLTRVFADQEVLAWVAGEPAFTDCHATRAVVARMRVVHDEFSFQPSTTQPLPFAWGA